MGENGSTRSLSCNRLLESTVPGCGHRHDSPMACIIAGTAKQRIWGVDRQATRGGEPWGLFFLVRDNDSGEDCATTRFADVRTKTFFTAAPPWPFGRPLLFRCSRPSPHRQLLPKSAPHRTRRCRPTPRSPAQTAWRSLRPVARSPQDLLRLTSIAPVYSPLALTYPLLPGV